MIVTSFLLAVLICCCHGADPREENPIVFASQGGQKTSNLLPELERPDVPPPTEMLSADSRGRSDIEIEEEEEGAPRGYFYPKPAKPFNLPEFTTLDASAPLDASLAPLDASLAQEDVVEAERLPRSPRRRPQFPSPPPFIPGWIPPHNIRPLPALYGRPGGYY